jgi:hypothetical protein
MHYDGNSWSLVTSPAVHGELRYVAAFSHNDVWAAGTEINGPLIVHWNGSSWSKKATPPGADRGLRGLDAVPGGELWTLGLADDGSGSPSKTFLEVWDGNSWSDVPTFDVVGTLSSVDAVSATQAWAVGTYAAQSGRSLVEHWDGSQWDFAAVPSSGIFDALSDVEMLSPTDVWSVGGFNANDFKSRTFIQHICPVAVRDAGFSPDVAVAGQGHTAFWTFASGATAQHSVADASGMNFFDSGPKPPGSSFAFTFMTSGGYPIVDPSTGETGTVQVPMRVRPTTGSESTPFQIRWAEAPPPTRLTQDVQIKRPGAGSFVGWRRGTEQISGTFLPDSGPGIYLFRARLREKVVGGGATDWSPVRIIEVG